MEQWNDGIVGQQIKAKCNRGEAKASFTQYPILPIFHFRFFVHPLFHSSSIPFFLSSSQIPSFPGFIISFGSKKVFNRFSPHRLDDLRDEWLMIELALTLAPSADVAFVNGIHQGIIPFEVSAQEASGIRNFALGGFKPFKTKFFSRRTDGSTERRRTVVIGFLAGPAGRASPYRVFKFFKSGDIPFHDNLL